MEMDRCGSNGLTLRSGETAGLLAPCESSVTGVAHNPTREMAPPWSDDPERSPAGRNLFPPLILGGYLTGPTLEPKTCARSQANELSDFLRLVAQTRVPDAGGAPAPGAAEAAALQCYGGGISGTGDVEGPSSSTDNAIARYDGTTGTQLSNSSATLDDAGRIAATALSLTDDLAVAHGGTGASTAADARTNLGLGSLAVKNSVATGDIDANAVTDAKLRDSAALSVIGRSANSTGDPADIAAGSDHQVLRRSGTSIGFGAVNLAQSAAVTGALPIANGGTGATQARDALSNLGTLKSTVIEYTGSGASGKTVTLTGINRAYSIVFFNQSNNGSVWVYQALPNGSTGTLKSRALADGSVVSTLSLDAPSAGTAQVLTISNNSVNFNANLNTYRLLVIGTST